MIRRVIIKNYRGIEERNINVAEAGALIKGRNGSGKTSILNAIESALLARDVAPEAIRKGADKAEILVDLDAHSVRRVITQKGNTLTVTKEGMRAPAPQTYLMNLLGTCSLSPMDLLLLKGKARKAKVLEAFDCHLTIEQLRQWVPKIPDGFDVSGHGLEVLERARAKAYEQRTRANAEAKIARQDASKAAKHLADTPDVGSSDYEYGPVTREVEAAKADLVALKSRAAEYKRSSERTAATRAKIAELHAKAKAERAGAVEVSSDELDKWRETVVSCHERVCELEAALRFAQENLKDARDALNELENKHNAFACAMSNAVKFEGQAAELEVAIAQASVEPVSEEDLARATVRVADANAASLLMQTHVEASAEHFVAKEELAAAEVKAHLAEAEAARLDAIVKALTNEAPAALLAQSEGIPGLSLRDDDVLLDGISLDSLCGAEQVRFCVEVARRANAKSKVLVVDGLERLDPEQCDTFIHEATRDGWQLLATRVDRGDVVIEAIESTVDAAAE